MSGRAAGGAAWTVAGFAATQGLRFSFNVALARLVAPEVFGVMALVNVLIQGLQMFSDIGLRQCVVQHPRGDESAFLNTAWTAQIARGAALWAGSGALAWPMAAVYGEPALLWLLPLTGLGAFVSGFSSTAVLTYTRRVNRGPLVVREVAVYAVTFGAVVAAVWLLRGDPGRGTREAELAVIALGAVATAAGGVALSFTLPSAARHRLAWEPEAGRALLRFGGWVFVSSGLTFLAAQADRLVVGKLSMELLGVYHIAAVIVALPVGVLGALGMNLVFPLLSEAARRGEPLAGPFGAAHRWLGAASGLLVTGAACVGPAFVGAVYDDRYGAAGGFIRLLAVAAWWTALLTAGEMALLALGRVTALALAQGVRLVCLPALMWAGYRAGGVPGFVLGVAAGEAVRYVVVAALLARCGVRAWPRDAALTLAAAASVGVYLVLEAATGGTGGAALPLAGAAALVAFWSAVLVASVGTGGLPGSARRWLAGRRGGREAGT